MRNPFKRASDPPRLVKRIEQLEITAADVEDTIEKVLYQQQRILGKVNARHKRELKEAEIALDGPEGPPPMQGDPNGMAQPYMQGDLKAHLRAQAAQLRRR